MKFPTESEFYTVSLVYQLIIRMCGCYPWLQSLLLTIAICVCVSVNARAFVRPSEWLFEFPAWHCSFLILSNPFVTHYKLLETRSKWYFNWLQAEKEIWQGRERGGKIQPNEMKKCFFFWKTPYHSTNSYRSCCWLHLKCVLHGMTFIESVNGRQDSRNNDSMAIRIKSQQQHNQLSRALFFPLSACMCDTIGLFNWWLACSPFVELQFSRHCRH